VLKDSALFIYDFLQKMNNKKYEKRKMKYWLIEI